METAVESVLDQLEAVYRANVRRVHGFANARLGPDDALDVVAEVFHAAAVAAREGRIEQVTPAWLMAVTRNKIADHWRRAYRRKARAHLTHVSERDLMEFPADWSADPRRADVLAALDRLSPYDRSLLVLHHVDGTSTADLAEAANKSVSAIESALARARRRFKSHYAAVYRPDTGGHA